MDARLRERHDPEARSRQHRRRATRTAPGSNVGPVSSRTLRRRDRSGGLRRRHMSDISLFASCCVVRRDRAPYRGRIAEEPVSPLATRWAPHDEHDDPTIVSTIGGAGMGSVEGKMDKGKGRVKEAVGDLTDNKSLKNEGRADRVGGASRRRPATRPTRSRRPSTASRTSSRGTEPAPPRAREHQLAPVPESAAAPPSWTERSSWGCRDSSRKRVVVTELVSNVVRHAGTDVAIQSALHDDTVRIGVRTRQRVSGRADRRSADWGPRPASVDELSDRWGVDRHAGRKVVWAEWRVAVGRGRRAR